MEKSKKIFLGVLLLIFLIIIIIALFLNGKDNLKEKPPKDNINEKRFGKVDDYEEFFSIQATINDINNVGMNTSYTAKEIYVSTISDTYYYFINSYKFEDSNYEQNIYLLLVLDKSNDSYELSEINETINELEVYAKNYDVKSKEINTNNKLLNGSGSLRNVMTTYISYFKRMLIIDTYSAYNMLHEDTKSKYIDYNDFNAQALNIYDSLSSVIFSLNSGGEDNDTGEKKYYFEDDNRNKITIYEESIMNFKISY